MNSPCILLVQYSASLDGSAVSGLMLADGLKEAGWQTHVAFGHKGPMVAPFAEAGHQVHVIPHKSWLRTARHIPFLRNCLNEIRTAESFVPLLRKIRPSVVYINTAVSMAGALAARREGVPVIWHLRELFEDIGGEMRVPVGFKALVQAFVRSTADAIVCNSHAVRANLVGRSMNPELHVVPNAVEAFYFVQGQRDRDDRGRFGLPKDGLVLGIPGTLRPMKGHLFFLGALRRLVQDVPDVTVAITGGISSTYAEQVVQQAKAYGLDQKVHFIGSIEDMPSFYRSCTAVCVPSVAEPFGRTVIEAFASGVPVVATAVGGMLETVENGVSGVLVPYGDEEALAGALSRVLTDGALREQLRTNALQKARELYHESVYKTGIARIVQDAALRAGTSAPTSADTSPTAARESQDVNSVARGL